MLFTLDITCPTGINYCNKSSWLSLLAIVSWLIKCSIEALVDGNIYEIKLIEQPLEFSENSTVCHWLEHHKFKYYHGGHTYYLLPRIFLSFIKKE